MEARSRYPRIWIGYAVTVQPNARILRITPGAKDLKNATPLQLQDLQVGDRVRVRGAGPGRQNDFALEVIVIPSTDVEAVSTGAAGLAEARSRRIRKHQWTRPRPRSIISVTGVGGKERSSRTNIEEHSVPPLCGRLGAS